MQGTVPFAASFYTPHRETLQRRSVGGTWPTATDVEDVVVLKVNRLERPLHILFGIFEDERTIDT